MRHFADMTRLSIAAGLLLVPALAAHPVATQETGGCKALPTHAALKKALAAAQAQPNGGLGFHMWGTVVDRDGFVCDVAFTGGDRGDQWPGSRVISAQKANTANAFSLPKFALSTANLFSPVQPGQSLFGLQESNPVDPSVAYGGPAAQYRLPHRSDERQTDRRRERVWRWTGSLHGGGHPDWRRGRER